jgi:hypothetical protein
MRESHLAVAASRGSLGVGRFTFCVRTEDGRVFELYYDADCSSPTRAQERR